MHWPALAYRSPGNAHVVPCAALNQRGVLKRSGRLPEGFEDWSQNKQWSWLIKRGKIAKRRGLGGGKNESIRVTFAGTTPAGNYFSVTAVVKPTDAQFQNETASYVLARWLYHGRRNLVPFTTDTILDGRISSAQVYVAGAEPADRWIRENQDTWREMASGHMRWELSDALVLDRILRNGDRWQQFYDVSRMNLKNVMISPDGHLVLIDNGWTLGRGQYRRLLPTEYHPTTRANLQRMYERWPELEAELREHLTGYQVWEVRRSIEEMLANAARTTE